MYQCLWDFYFREDLVVVFLISLFVVLGYYIVEFSLPFTGRSKEEYVYVVDTKYKVHRFLAYKNVMFVVFASFSVMFYFTVLTVFIPFFYSSEDKQKVAYLCEFRERFSHTFNQQEKVKLISAYIAYTKKYELLKRNDVLQLDYKSLVSEDINKIKSKYSLYIHPLSLITAKENSYRLFVLLSYTIPVFLVYLGLLFKRKLEKVVKEFTSSPKQIEPIPISPEDYKTIFDFKVLGIDQKLFEEIVGDIKKVQALFVKSITADVKSFVGEHLPKPKEGQVVYSADRVNRAIRYVLNEIEHFAETLQLYKEVDKQKANCYLTFLLHHYIVNLYGNLPSGLLVVNVKDKTLKRLLGIYQRKLLLREHPNMTVYDKQANEVLTALFLTTVFDRKVGLYVGVLEYLKSEFDPLPFDL